MGSFESAGETERRGKEIGYYVGVYGGDWLDMNGRDAQNWGLQAHWYW